MSDVTASPPHVSVLIPALNEEKYISKCLDSLLASGYPLEQFEIIVADGGSTDRTRTILNEYHLRHAGVRWIPNALIHQAGGVNLAAEAAHPASKYFIRVDAHALYPAGFIPDVVATAEETGAELVVYVNEPHYETPFQRAVAFAFAHPLGVGDSKYRLGHFTGEVEHGQQGCFRRECFEKLGGYDINIVPNEDSELSWRVRASGGRVWLNSRLRMRYYPRRSLRALARQYFHYGRGRALNCGKNRQWPRLRQLAPPLLIALELLLVVAAPFCPWLLVLLGPYLLLVVGVAAMAILRQRALGLIRLVPVFLTMHHLWGLGFYVGAVEVVQRLAATRFAMRDASNGPDVS